MSLPVSLSPGLPVCSTWSLIPGWLDALRSLVGMWFQVHYPPLKGVLPIVRSRYWFAIGRQRVLSLAGWAPQIQTRFHVSGLTQVPAHTLSLFA